LEAGIRNLPQVEPKRPLSPELLYQQQGQKKAHFRLFVIDGFKQTTSQLRPLLVASFRQTTSQLLSLSPGLRHPMPGIAGITKALAAILIVWMVVNGFIWLLEGPRFTVGESTIGSRSHGVLPRSFLSSPAPTLSPTPVPLSPILAVSPAGLGPNNCILGKDSWTCTVTLSLASGFQGNLNWSASSNLSDVAFTPSSGTLAPGQSVRVTISISDVTCPATTTLSFEGPRNTVDVAWSCSSHRYPLHRMSE
jgi:hypothetical protein